MAVIKHCNENKIRELLPWFAMERISSEDKKRVEEHLRKCEYCRKLLDNIRQFSDSFNVVGSDATNHVSPVLLTIFSENKSELDNKIIRRIEDHLVVCNECAEEFRLLQLVNSSLDQGSQESFIERLHQVLVNFFEGRYLRPVYAYLLILLLVYPAYLGIFRKGSEPVEINEPVTVQKLFVLEAADSRSMGQSINRILLEKSPELITLSFNIPVSVDEVSSYHVFIKDMDDKTIWEEKNVIPADAFGNIIIMCSTQFFTEGNYSITAENKGSRKENETNRYQFGFNVRMNEKTLPD